MAKLRLTLILPLGGVVTLLVAGCMSPPQIAALLAGPYPLQVDYSASLADALAGGHYAWTNSLVTPANFPAPQAGNSSLSGTLLRFSPQASPDYIRSRAPTGSRPATLWELLAFGKAYPEVQETIPVVGLGSHADLVVNTYEHFNVNGGLQTMTKVIPKLERLYPFLGGGLPGRVVGLEWLDDPAGYGMYYALFVTQQ